MNDNRSRALFAGVLLVGVHLSAAHAQEAPLYKITQTVPLGAPDRWDYVVVDEGANRVYVSHSDRVDVVDSKKGTVIGQIAGFPGGTHGIAIARKAGRGYTDDGRAGTAASFNLSTFAVEKTLKADNDADAVTFDPVSGHVFVVDGVPAKLTVIDPVSDAVIASVDGGGKLEYPVSGKNGKLYVNGAEKQEIVRVDTKTNLADAHWPMPGCVNPHGLAIDTVHHRLFSGCANGVLVVVNTDDGSHVVTLPIGNGNDAVAFDPKRKRVFSSNGQDGTLTVIQEQDANTFVVADTIKTAISGRTMGIDTRNGRLFIAAADVDTAAAAAAPPPPADAAASGPPRRLPTVPGSLKLLILDPVK